MSKDKAKTLLQYLDRPALMIVYDEIKRRAMDRRCRISVRELSEATNLAHATVQRAIRRLLADGVIEAESGRYPSEPTTFILKQVDTADRLVEARSILTNISKEISMIDALISSLSRYPEDILKDAERFRKLVAAISSVTQITPEYVQVIVDVQNIDDEMKHLLKIEKSTTPD